MIYLMNTGANVNDHDEVSAAAAVCSIFPHGIPYFITAIYILVLLFIYRRCVKHALMRRMWRTEARAW
jgi:hypothetical protein